MDRRPLLPGAVVALLAIALLIYLIEKIGQALLTISNVILLVTLAWILTLILRPVVNGIHRLTMPERFIRPHSPSLGRPYGRSVGAPLLWVFDHHRLPAAAHRSGRVGPGLHPGRDRSNAAVWSSMCSSKPLNCRTSFSASPKLSTPPATFW